jgi:hypothetical protein
MFRHVVNIGTTVLKGRRCQGLHDRFRFSDNSTHQRYSLLEIRACFKMIKFVRIMERVNLGIIRSWVIILTLRPLYPGKREKASVPIGWQCGPGQELVWTWQKKENFYPCRESNSGPPVIIQSLYKIVKVYSVYLTSAFGRRIIKE